MVAALRFRIHRATVLGVLLALEETRGHVLLLLERSCIQRSKTLSLLALL